MYIDFSTFANQSNAELASYYPAHSHEKALLNIADGLRSNYNLFFLRGECGVGKTHILNRLYHNPRQGFEQVRYSAARPTINGIMRTIASVHGQCWDKRNPNTLRRFLVNQLVDGKTTVIYVDDVVKLNPQLLIKLSKILRWHKTPLAKVVFAGTYQLTPIHQRLIKQLSIKAMLSSLHGLDEVEISAYLKQLSQASAVPVQVGEKSPFSRAVIHAITEYSQGIPEKINQLCEFSQVLLRHHHLKNYDVALIEQAVQHLDLIENSASRETVSVFDSVDIVKKTIRSSINVAKQKKSQVVQQQQQDQVVSTSSNSQFLHDASELIHDPAIQLAANKQNVIRNESRLAEDEWEQARLSYFRKHPKSRRSRSAVASSAGVKRPVQFSIAAWLIPAAVLAALVGGLYYAMHYGPQQDSALPLSAQNNNGAKPALQGSGVFSEMDGQDIHRRENAESALILAVWNNQLLGMQDLLRMGADVDTRNHFEQTPVMIAAMLGNQNAVSVLVKNDADLNLVDNKGRTALILGAMNGQTQVLEYLLKNGADVNIQDKRGMTALMHAASSGHTDTVELILSHHPELGIKDYSGRSAHNIAVSVGDQAIADIIQRAG